MDLTEKASKYFRIRRGNPAYRSHIMRKDWGMPDRTNPRAARELSA
jgi:hypothetical protein